MNYASCFVQTCIFIVAMVTGQLLGLKGDGGCVLIENERLKYLEKSLTHGIFVIPSAKLPTDMVYRASTK